MKDELIEKWDRNVPIKLEGLSPDEQIELVLQVVEKHQYMKVNEAGHTHIIDATSAGMFKAVYEAINEENKEKTKRLIAKMGLNHVILTFIELCAKTS